eukprot:GHVP01057532.1.p1 GENE.GHVP01057532.1~~GHVP01057532.1.p1  ORF type:complete len:155 (-),score=37.03 GHVP01057532.1:127-591(-)
MFPCQTFKEIVKFLNLKEIPAAKALQGPAAKALQGPAAEALQSNTEGFMEELRNVFDDTRFEEIQSKRVAQLIFLIELSFKNFDNQDAVRQIVSSTSLNDQVEAELLSLLFGWSKKNFYPEPKYSKFRMKILKVCSSDTEETQSASEGCTNDFD